MSLHILLIFPEAQWELAKDLRELLEETPSVKATEGEVKIVKNVRAAWENLEERQYHYDLLVVYLHLPPDQMSPLDLSAQSGLAFLQFLGKREHPPPSILVAPARDEDLCRAVELLPKCTLALEGEQLAEKVLHQAQKYLAKITYRLPAARPVHTLEEPKTLKPKVFGNVDIWLNLHSQPYSPSHCPGHYEMNIYEPGLGETYVGSGCLWLDWRTLYDLATKSRDLENLDKYPWPQWKDELEAVGGSLRNELCGKDEDFVNNFKSLLKKVKNNIKNTRIRFKLSLGRKEDSDPRAKFSEHLQAVVLEALLDDQKKFLMLQAPIYRRLDPSSLGDVEYLKPLFYDQADAQGLKCLIIEADTQGIVSLVMNNCETVRNLEPLSHLRDESRGLEAYLQGRHQVFRLSKDQLPNHLSFKERLIQVLEQEGPWHLVHYAGHSLYAEDQTGYVFFPGKKTAEAMNIEGFSNLLRRAQVRFVYLSSCQSSEDDFAFQLANKRVPAILGFRWKIDDDKAKEYALQFYKYLFKHRSLEQAFFEARRYFHDRYEDNRIWASPLLILQSP